MRETYPLTDETRKVLTDKVSAIATEWDKHSSYLYQILSSVEPDPFAKFKSLYAAAVRAGADVSTWDAALTAIKSRYGAAAKHESECLADLLFGHAEIVSKWVDALADGVISEREAVELRKAIQKGRDSLDVLDALLNIRAEHRAAAASKTAARFASAK